LVIVTIHGGVLLAAQRTATPPSLGRDAATRQDRSQAVVVDELRALRAEVRSLRGDLSRTKLPPSQEPSDNNAPIWSNWILVCVASATAFVAFRTLKSIEREVHATGQAAAAAKASADATKLALTVANRPKLTLGPLEVSGFDGRGIGTELTNGRLWVTNTGVLPTTVEKYWADWRFYAVLPVENPAQSAIDTEVADGQCPPGRSLRIDLPKYDVGFEVFHTINTNAQAIDEGKWTPDSSPVAGNLFVIGCIKYRDEVGLRRTYFAYRWNWREGRFDVVDHPNYNYES
jgi:hypothetical protein